MGKKIAIIVLVLLIIYNLGYIYYMRYINYEQIVEHVIGLDSEYVDYDFMSNPSDKLAKSLQEIKFDNLPRN